MGKRRSKRGSRRENEKYFEEMLLANGMAKQEGPSRKSWTMHDLKNIKPLTPTQEDMFHSWFNGYNLCAYGSAGTGKTFLAIYLGLIELFRKNQRKIVLVRSAVPTREVGHLPGTLEEKIAEYERPYHDILWELIGRQSTYQDMKDAEKIEFMVTSFTRGLTIDNSIVVVDEGQNMTFHEINTIMSRLGDNSRVIFTGDLIQTDLDGSKKHGTCGMRDFLEVIGNMDNFKSHRFVAPHDVVRGDFARSWITAVERYNMDNKKIA